VTFTGVAAVHATPPNGRAEMRGVQTKKKKKKFTIVTNVLLSKFRREREIFSTDS
jgi:hypothetical protein